MTEPATSPDAGPAFEIEPRDKVFEAFCAIPEFEMHPGRTLSFLSEVDLTEVERLRGRAGATWKPSYTAFVVKAVALALRDCPDSNRRVCRRASSPFAGHRFQKFHRRDVAVAIEREFPGSGGAAFFDIVRDADRLPMATITETLRALSTADVTTNTQWREFSTIIARLPHRLAMLLIRLPYAFPSLWVKYRGGAVLISSPAKYGVGAVLGTWPHPLGVSFGLVKPRPLVIGGEVVARPTFALTLNFDRRVTSGVDADRFFKRVIDVLENAEAEMAPYFSPPCPAAQDSPPPDTGPGYEIEPRDKVFEATRATVDQEIRPEYTLTFVRQVDLTAVERLRDRTAGAGKPSYTALVVKAVSLALRESPPANRRVFRRPWSFFAGHRIQSFPRCDLAVAVEHDPPGPGSAVPVEILRDADRLSLATLTDRLRPRSVGDVTETSPRGGSGTTSAWLPRGVAAVLSSLPCVFPDLWVKHRGGAVMISSPARAGADVVAGTWTHSLGVSFGLVKPRPVVRGSEVVAAPTFSLTLNFDRRVLSHAQATRFFGRVVHLLEHAEDALEPFVPPTNASPRVPVVESPPPQTVTLSGVSRHDDTGSRRS